MVQKYLWFLPLLKIFGWGFYEYFMDIFFGDFGGDSPSTTPLAVSNYISPYFWFNTLFLGGDVR